MTELLNVWVGDKRVGELLREEYEYSFQYLDPASLDPTRDLVSLTMPVRNRRYDTQVLMPPFQMALPEGALLDHIRARFGKLVDVTNDLVLLRLVGNNTIGRVRFSEPGEPPKAPLTTPQSLQELLLYPETGTLFTELFETLASQSGVSGVQPKVLWSEAGKKAALTTDKFILKTAGPDYPLLATNEYYCLRAAQAAGLTTPDFQLGEHGDLLAVKRFDLDTGGHQLAFEEICALMERPTGGKYMASYEQVVEIIQRVPCEPRSDAMQQIYKAIALSMFLRNGDAHLKNFGILYDTINQKWLAPIYDVVCTTAYIPRDVPALTMDGKKAWPDDSTLIEFGIHACGLRRRDVNRCLLEVRVGLASLAPMLEADASKSAANYQLSEHLRDLLKN